MSTGSQSEQIESLVRRLEASSDPATQATARELVQALLELHGAGLLRLMELVDEAGDAGARLVDRFTRDAAVNRLLLLHGLHPLGFEARVQQSVDALKEQVRSQNATIEAVRVDELGGVLVQVTAGARHGCGTSPSALARAIEDAIYDVAPEATAIVIEGLSAEPGAPLGFVSLDALRRPKAALSRPQMEAAPAAGAR